MLDTYARFLVQPLIQRVARTLADWGIAPNTLTAVAFLSGLLASGAFCLGLTYPALFLLWFSGFLDTLDGMVARLTEAVSLLGTLFDLFAVTVFFTGVVKLREACFKLKINKEPLSSK